MSTSLPSVENIFLLQPCTLFHSLSFIEVKTFCLFLPISVERQRLMLYKSVLLNTTSLDTLPQSVVNIRCKGDCRFSQVNLLARSFFISVKDFPNFITILQFGLDKTIESSAKMAHLQTISITLHLLKTLVSYDLLIKDKKALMHNKNKYGDKE